MPGRIESDSAPELSRQEGSPNMRISSPDFNNGQPIPSVFSCKGEDKPPRLDFSDVPKSAVSLAVIMDDPDAPAGTWTHWTVWNIHTQAAHLDGKFLPPDARQGMTSAGTAGYHGPCPPSGTHRYIFHLYALDRKLKLADGAQLAVLVAAIKGHIVGKSDLMGTFSHA